MHFYFLNRAHKHSVVANQLPAIPDSFFKLEKLTYLDLSMNRVFELPSTIQFLTALTILRITQNDLVEVPEEVCKARVAGFVCV